MNRHEEELLVDDYYTVGVVFSSDPTAKHYTYKVDDSMKLEVEDLVVILADGQFKIVRVRAVHNEAKINFNSSVDYKYVVDKVDMTTYNMLQERSTKIAETLAESKRRTLKSTLVGQFKDGLGEDDVKALTDAGVETKGWL